MPAHDMTATIHCAGCQHAYIETALFCPNCGRPKVREVVSYWGALVPREELQSTVEVVS